MSVIVTPSVRAVVAVVSACLAAPAFADGNAPIVSREVTTKIDSGPLAATGEGIEPRLITTLAVAAPGSTWVRLDLAGTVLPGDAASNDAFIVIRSGLDGAEQYLDRDTIAQWSFTSAYFNGESVTIDVYARPGVGDARIMVGSIWASAADPYAGRSICGPTDDRVLSNDPASARLLPTGCTAWLFDDANRTFLTAGHCGTAAGSVVQFNVPLSTSTGGLQHPPPEHQYPVDLASVQRGYTVIGNDWAYFGAFPNSNTGLTAYQAQNASFRLAAAAPLPAGQSIRITGYGTTGAGIPREWNQVQKTHAGGYASLSGTIIRYTPDTTGGNSGSAVLDESTGLAIGIHTNAGCNSSGGSNQGTAIQNAGLRLALMAPRGVSGSGIAAPGGDIFIAGDINNNFGTINPTTGGFGAMRRVGPFIEGLAFDAAAQRFIAIDQANLLYAIDTNGWSLSNIGPVAGVSGTLNGLAMDATGTRLWGIVQATGQLYEIDFATLDARPMGAAWGGRIGCLETIPGSGMLFGIDDSASGSRLVRIDPATGSVAVVGNLGAGATDCNGLAYSETDGSLYTVDAATRLALRVNPATGVATVIGPSGGVFNASFGMAARTARPACPADIDRSGAVDVDDLGAFFDAWQRGLTPGDFNEDGGVDGEDIAAFIDRWQAGC